MLALLLIARRPWPFALMFLLAAPTHTAVAQLQSDQIAILVNTNSPDSKIIADHYCLKRSVPTSHIIALPMDTSEIISRRTYDEHIAPVIRDRLNHPDLKDKIKCLLTVRGVPLRIGPVLLDKNAAKKRDLVNARLKQEYGRLKQLTVDLNNLTRRLNAQPPLPSVDLKNFSLPWLRRIRDVRAQIILRDARNALTLTQKTLAAQKPTSPPQQQNIRQFAQLTEKWGGLKPTIRVLESQIAQDPDAATKKILQQQLEKNVEQYKQIAEQINQIDRSPFDIDSLNQHYRLIAQAGGLNDLCLALLTDRHRLGDEESNAAFDSELSLILWKPYRLATWQPNPLRVYPPDIPSDPNDPALRQPTLMVARIDGPSRKIAIGLIDKALAAEKTLLRGTAYIDARGIHDRLNTFGTPGNFDQDLRDTADYLTKHTGLKIVLDDKETLFPPGACPDTILYCGWYSLRNYIDAFRFNLGAVGYHIASFEAETLRATNNDNADNSNLWCKRMLEHGVTATFGAVAEPYLHSFAQPNRFFAELTQGRYCLVECFYRTKPFNSWMLTLIGDPLYRPQFAKSKGFKPNF